MKHHVLLADPPWSYKDKLKMPDGVQRSSDSQYETMSVDQIALFHLPQDELEYDSLLFLWTTNPFVLDGSGARVCKAWGYTPKQLITWVKGREVERQVIYRMGLGHYTRGVTEHIILAVRGEATWLIEDKGVLNYFETDGGMAFVGAPGAHSSKPDESYQLIERLCKGPYLELFARKRRAGWTQYGDQLK